MEGFKHFLVIDGNERASSSVVVRSHGDENIYTASVLWSGQGGKMMLMFSSKQAANRSSSARQ